jgi:hypothetical protein
MGGLEYLIPVLIVLVFIVGHFLKSSQKEENGRRIPVRRARPGEDTPARRGSTDIDRFLDEVNRRRRQALERRTGPIEEQTPLGVPPVVRQRRTATQQRPQVSVAVPRGRAAPPRPVPLARSVDPAPVVEVLPVVEIPSSPLLQTEPTWQPAPAASIQDSPSSTSLALTNLLSQQDNLRAAIVLQEILGPPLSRRRAAK